MLLHIKHTMFILKTIITLYLVKKAFTVCLQDSPDSSNTWVFSGNAIQCETTPKEIHFCNIFDLPQDLACYKMNFSSPKDLSIREGILIHWRCDSSYDFYIKCPKLMSTCTDSMDLCFAIYNPSVEILTTLSTLLVVLFLGTTIVLCLTIIVSSKNYMYLLTTKANTVKKD